MKALILNSGIGTRMGDLTNESPKCMTEIEEGETILSRQLKLLQKQGISEVVITTGYFNTLLVEYCYSLQLPLKFQFVNNLLYNKTNYIYSIYLAKDYLLDDIILMHGDLIFDEIVLEGVLKEVNSCMAISTTQPLPDKDFKAVIKDDLISKVGIDYFKNAVAAQPLYKINRRDWEIWLDNIISFCEQGQVDCYAENAFNEISNNCRIYPYDFKDRLCAEVDTPNDLKNIQTRLS